MGKYNEQYGQLWDTIKGRGDAVAKAVGGDFETVGKLEFALLRSLCLQEDWSVIDVGCGSGRLASQLAPWLRGPFLGTDILRPLLDHARALCARPDWRFARSDGQVIPALTGSADLVCFFSVLTHITHEETWRYLREAKRVLKPGGLIVCSFLEFRIRSHWAIFREDVRDRSPGKVLNQFLSRDALDAFAFNAGLQVTAFFDGDKPHLPIDGELAYASGYSVRERGNLGQSICVLQKPLRAIPEPDAVEAALSAGAEPTAPGTQVVCNVVARCWDGPHAFSSVDAAETAAHSCDGALFYVASEALPGTDPLYRLRSPDGSGERMDSLTPDEAGYVRESLLGHVWSAPLAGTQEVRRSFHPQRGHASQSAREPGLPGYRLEMFGRFAFNRFLGDKERLAAVEGGGVVIASDAVAGGSVRAWTWNGKSFLRDADPRHGLQTSLGCFDGDREICRLSEAGAPGITAESWLRQGSPVIELAAREGGLSTRCVPADSNPIVWGGDARHPVLWTDVVLGKDLTLDYEGMGPVAKYAAYLRVPHAVRSVEVEFARAWLPEEFSRCSIFDAAAGELRPVSAEAPPFGALIASTADGSFAFAIYAVSTEAGGPLNGFSVRKAPGEGTRIAACSRAAPLAGGEHRFNAWIVTGTLESVQPLLRELYVWGAL